MRRSPEQNRICAPAKDVKTPYFPNSDTKQNTLQVTAYLHPTQRRPRCEIGTTINIVQCGMSALTCRSTGTHRRIAASTNRPFVTSRSKNLVSQSPQCGTNLPFDFQARMTGFLLTRPSDTESLLRCRCHRSHENSTHCLLGAPCRTERTRGRR